MARLSSPDWFRVITDLIYAGISMREISRRVDATMCEKLLRHYRAGGQPNYVRGEALVKLWCDVLNKGHHELPRQPWYPPTRLGGRRNRGLRA